MLGFEETPEKAGDGRKEEKLGKIAGGSWKNGSLESLVSDTRSGGRGDRHLEGVLCVLFLRYTNVAGDSFVFCFPM